MQQNPFNGVVISNADDDKSNYMDYTPYTCRNHFTQGQINRMQFILDPTYGALKSLLGGSSACADCGTMTGYQPLIQGVPTIATTVNESVNLSFNASFVSNSGPFTTAPVTYSWTLQLLDGTPLQAPTQSNANPFNAGSLVAGNYSITLNAIINSNCFKTTTSYFSITPNSSNCNLQMPTSNSLWSNWERVYYENGWSRSGATPTSPYTNVSTTRTIIPNNSSNSVDNGFDIIDISQLASTDSNFNIVSITLPTTNPAPPTNIKLMRVGKKISASADLKDGAAYYVNYTFKPTKENCKYRVWYIGISNVGVIPTTVAYQNFNVTQPTSTSFGFLSRYKLNTTAIIGSSPSPPVTYLGMNENGYLIGAPGSFSNVKSKQFGLNDMVFGRCHSVLTNNTSNIGTIPINNTPYVRTIKWQYYDIDFSEFVDTPGYVLGTDITLTFFARTNDAIPAISHSYAYFGIECKGGGMPADLTMDFPNVQLPCQQGSKSYLNTIYLPRPKYALEKKPDNGNSYFSWLNPSDSFNGNYSNLATIKVESSTNSNGGFTPLVVVDYLKNVSTDDRYSENYLYLTNENPPNTSLFYRVTLKTLHKTLVSLFKVTNGNRINESPPCIERLGVIAAGSETINFNSNQTNELSYQSLTNCDANTTPPQAYYIWKKYTCADATCTTFTEPTVITDATGPSLTINTSDYQNCRTYIARYTSFEYPYCGNQFYKASVFTLNNTSAFSASSYTASKTDICITGTFNLTISNFKLTLPNCPIPFFQDNKVKLQLAKTSNGSILLGNTQIINFNSTLNNTVPIFDLSFNNQITPGNYEFPSNGTFTIYLRIEYNLFGSTTPVVEYKPITFNISNSPVPGALGAVTANCSTFSIANSSATTTSFDNQWGWQYSSAFDGVYSNIPAPTSPFLSNYLFSQIPVLPFFIRRVSNGGIGSCANPTYTVPVKVTNIPIFDNPLSICRAVTTTLPLPLNGVIGSWNTVLPNPTITTIYSSTNYPDLTGPITFTVDRGCTPAITQQPTITINVIPVIANLPALPATTSQTVCEGTSFSQLNPTNSSVAGCVIRWYLSAGGSSEPIDSSLQIPISNPPATYYPANYASGCRGPKSGVVVTVTPKITPTFAQVPAICSGSTLAALPTTSNNPNNAITGTWLPALNNTSTTKYTFAPANGQCATTQTMTITVNPNTTPTFVQVPAICSGATLAALPTTSNNTNNAITGTWSPPLNSTATTIYTFTPTAGQCASTTQMTINVTIIATANFNFSATPISNIVGGQTQSVLTNTPTATINTVSINPPTSNIYFNPNGTITVAPSTPIGTYVISYTLNQNECTSTSNSTATVSVLDIPVIIADDYLFGTFCYDDSISSSNFNVYNLNNYDSGIAPTVNGVPATPANMSIVPVQPFPTWVSYNSSGFLVIDSFAPPGIYDLSVNFCPIGFNSGCKTEYLHLRIEPPISVFNEGNYFCNSTHDFCYTTPNVLNNDEVNCDQVPTAANSTLIELTNPENGFFRIDETNGSIVILDPEMDVPLNSIQTLTYKLCSNLFPSFCATGTLNIYVQNNARMSSSRNPNVFDKIHLVPNPSDTEFALFAETKMNTNKVAVEIYNLIGQKMLTIENYKLEETINISNLSKGTYLVRITSEDQEITKRLIKN